MIGTASPARSCGKRANAGAGSVAVDTARPVVTARSSRPRAARSPRRGAGPRRIVAESRPPSSLAGPDAVDDVRDDEERGARRDGCRGVRQAGERVAERARAVNRAHRAEQTLDDGELRLTLGDTRVDDGLRVVRRAARSLRPRERCRRVPRRLALPRHRGLGFLERCRQGLRLEPFGFEVRGRAIALGGEQRLHACALAFDLGARALALGGQRLVHFFASRDVACAAACSISRRTLLSRASCQLASLRCSACLLAHPLGRFGRRLLDFAADAVGLGHHAPLGIAGASASPALSRPCHSSRSASISFRWRSAASSAARVKASISSRDWSAAWRACSAASCVCSASRGPARLRRPAVARRRRRHRPARPAGGPATRRARPRLSPPTSAAFASVSRRACSRAPRRADRPPGRPGSGDRPADARRVRRLPYEDRDRPFQALSGRSVGKSSLGGACKPNHHNSLTNRDAERRIEGLVSRWGRPRFDGDMVSQDACRGPSPS